MADTPYIYVVTGAGRYPGATRNDDYGVTTYATKTGQLPKGLEGRAPAPHTWGRYLQRLLNNEPAPANTGAPIALRDHQQTPATGIVTAHDRNLPGYVLSYPTGSGKTYIAVDAINRMNPTRVLVIAPLSYLEEWRTVITRHATGETEWVVINPDNLIHLFVTTDDAAPALHSLPAEHRVATALEHGAPLADFDVVITDEAQILANADIDRTRLWQRLVGWPSDGGHPRAFTINLSATGWSKPQETVSAAHILAQAVHAPTPTVEELTLDYSSWLRSVLGLSMTTDETGRWRWDSNERDVLRLRHLLYDSGMGVTATREDLGLPAQNRRLHLISLNPTELSGYEQAWDEFCAQKQIISASTSAEDPAAVHYLRAIQKAAVIKAPHVAQIVVDYLEQGYQVVLPAWLSTTVRVLQDQINQAATVRLPDTPPLGYWAGTLTGATPQEHRAHKVKFFQGGYLPVLVTSVTESISLHAGQKGGTFPTETNPDGTATTAPRITVFGDVIHGGKRAFQAEGRASREAAHADVVYCCAPGTREAQAWAGVFHSLSDTRALEVGS